MATSVILRDTWQHNPQYVFHCESKIFWNYGLLYSFAYEAIVLVISVRTLI